MQTRSADNWRTLDSYAIRSPCGAFTIACVILSGQETYELWKWRETAKGWTSEKRVAVRSTQAAAMAAYERYRAALAARTESVSAQASTGT